MENTQIGVSIVCNAFNHERYIAQALESFLMQKTDFPFEILVHDDASTDGTAEIIRTYAKRFPQIVLPLFQTENQYSKNVSIGSSFQYPRARGKYIALCEGDDYWLSPDKLQQQFDFMEAHPLCAWCFSGAAAVDRAGNRLSFFGPEDLPRYFSAEDVIAGGGGFCATNTIFARTEFFRCMPSYVQTYSLDYMVQIYLSTCGDTYGISGELSAYRRNTEGSWSERMYRAPEAYVRHEQKLKKHLALFDEATGEKYHAAVSAAVDKLDFDILYFQRNYRALHQPRFKAVYAAMSPKARLKFRLDQFFPGLMNLYDKMKKKHGQL